MSSMSAHSAQLKGLKCILYTYTSDTDMIRTWDQLTMHTRRTFMRWLWRILHRNEPMKWHASLSLSERQSIFLTLK